MNYNLSTPIAFYFLMRRLLCHTTTIPLVLDPDNACIFIIVRAIGPVVIIENLLFIIYNTNQVFTMESSENFDYSQFEIIGMNKFEINSTLVNGTFDVPRGGESSVTTTTPPISKQSSAISKDHHGRTTYQMDKIFHCGCCVRQSVAVAYCNECVAFICSQCTYAHEHMTCFGQHQVCVLEKRSDMLANASEQFCSNHPETPARFFSWRFHELICSMCAATVSADDRMSTTEDAKRILSDKINENMEKISSQLAKCDGKMKRMNVCLGEADKIRIRVDVIYAKILQTLNECRDNLNVKLGGFVGAVTDSVTQINKMIASMQSVKERSSELQQFGLNELSDMACELDALLAIGLADDDDPSVTIDCDQSNIQTAVASIFGDLKIVWMGALHMTDNCILANIQLDSKSSMEPPQISQISVASLQSLHNDNDYKTGIESFTELSHRSTSSTSKAMHAHHNTMDSSSISELAVNSL